MSRPPGGIQWRSLAADRLSATVDGVDVEVARTTEGGRMWWHGYTVDSPLRLRTLLTRTLRRAQCEIVAMVRR